jgi:hypothetical protein
VNIFAKSDVEKLRYCQACGHSVDEDVLYCPACGKKLPDKTMTQGGIPLPPPPPYYGAPSNAPPVFGEADTKALHKLTIFAVIILVSLVAGFAFSFLFNPFGYVLLTNPAAVRSTPPSISLISNFLTYIEIGSLVALVVEIFTFLQLRSAFKTLSTVDRPRFKTPALLTLLLVIALPIAIVGLIIEFAGLIPYINTILQQQQSGQTNTVFPFRARRVLCGCRNRIHWGHYSNYWIYRGTDPGDLEDGIEIR